MIVYLQMRAMYIRSLLVVWFGLVSSIAGQASSYGEDGCPDERVSFELVTGKQTHQV